MLLDLWLEEMDIVKDVVISKATNVLSLPKNNQKIFSIFVHNYTFIKFDTSNLFISPSCKTYHQHLGTFVKVSANFIFVSYIIA